MAIDQSITKRRLRAWINLLNADQRASGETWYQDANVFARTVGQQYRLDIRIVVGVLAVTSVQNRWDLNKRDCEALCRAKYEGRNLVDVSVGTYARQKAKALAILKTTTPEHVRHMIGTRYAPKTKAFYDNILHPDTSELVTLDRWIFRGLDLEYLTNGAGNRHVAAYRAISQLVVAEARRMKMRPCALQAAIWLCIQQTAYAEQWEGSRPLTGLPNKPDDGIPI